MFLSVFLFFFSIRRRHTRCALVTGVQTCALPILAGIGKRRHAVPDRYGGHVLPDGIDNAPALMAERARLQREALPFRSRPGGEVGGADAASDRKSTRLNSSH